MIDLRRYYIEGGTYFFTVVANHRREILCEPDLRLALRHAIDHVRTRHPFEIVAWVLLPEHLHCIWTLPDGDADFSTRWRLLKKSVSFQMKTKLDTRSDRSPNEIKKQESGLWQHRFWEHAIRDETDLARHFDYIHFNPIKHGLVTHPADWKWSTYHRYVKMGIYNDKRLPMDEDIDAE
jgi:putative transposase